MHTFWPIPGHINTSEWLSYTHLRLNPRDSLPLAHLCSQWESAWLLPSPPAVRRLPHTRVCSHCVRETGPHPCLVEPCLGEEERKSEKKRRRGKKGSGRDEGKKMRRRIRRWGKGRGRWRRRGKGGGGRRRKDADKKTAGKCSAA